MVQPNSRLRGDDEDAVLVIQVGDNGEQIGGGVEPANCRFDTAACGFDERRARVKFPQNAADKSAYFSSSPRWGKAPHASTEAHGEEPVLLKVELQEVAVKRVLVILQVAVATTQRRHVWRDALEILWLQSDSDPAGINCECAPMQRRYFTGKTVSPRQNEIVSIE